MQGPLFDECRSRNFDLVTCSAAFAGSRGHGPLTSAQQDVRSSQVSGLRTPSTTWRMASMTNSGCWTWM